MCPYCSRGLTEKKEVCTNCEGTGFGKAVKVEVKAEPKVEKKKK